MLFDAVIKQQSRISGQVVATHVVHPCAKALCFSLSLSHTHTHTHTHQISSTKHLFLQTNCSDTQDDGKEGPYCKKLRANGLDVYPNIKESVPVMCIHMKHDAHPYIFFFSPFISVSFLVIQGCDNYTAVSF